MKKFLVVLLTLAMISSLMCGFTAFAAETAVTVVAAKDWENATYDSETGILSNGAYGFNVTLANKKLTLNSLVCDAPAEITEICIPKSVKSGKTTYTYSSIAEGLLSECTSLKTVYASYNLSVAKGLFSSKITDITIIGGDGVTVTLGADAFTEAVNAVSIKVVSPKSTVGVIGTSTLAMESLEGIYFDVDLLTINSRALQDCLHLDKIFIKDKESGEYKAVGEKNPETNNFKVTIYKEIVSGGTYSFTNKVIESVVFEEGVEAVGSGMFRDSSLAYVDFPSTLRSIGTFAFYNNSKLVSLDSDAVDDVYDLSQIDSVGQGAFYCTNADLKGTLILGVNALNKEALRGVHFSKIIYRNPVKALAQNAFFGISQHIDLVFEQGVDTAEGALSIKSDWVNSSSKITVLYPADQKEFMEQKFTIPTTATNVKIAPIGGYISDVLQADGGYNVSYTAMDYKNAGAAVIALYDKDGMMIGVKSVELTPTTNVEPVVAAVSANGIAGSAKIYLWSSMTEAKPLYEAYTDLLSAE